jgi:SAM-dependent methyltransferase
MAKDRFSTQSAGYARFRPRYPEAWYHWLLAQTPGRDQLWDCATGNGQAALALAPQFRHTYATDLSAAQLAAAEPHPAITYLCCPAEQTPFDAASFDLITVAQAVHWFDFEAFYAEVRRVGKPGGLLALWGYGLFSSLPAVDERIRWFYSEVVGPYWDPERRHLETGLREIPFPFEELHPPDVFRMPYRWTLEDLLGYLGTWSSVQRYREARGEDPIPLIAAELAAIPDLPPQIEAQVTLLIRAGRI